MGKILRFIPSYPQKRGSYPQVIVKNEVSYPKLSTEKR